MVTTSPKMMQAITQSLLPGLIDTTWNFHFHTCVGAPWSILRFQSLQWAPVRVCRPGKWNEGAYCDSLLLFVIAIFTANSLKDLGSNVQIISSERSHSPLITVEYSPFLSPVFFSSLFSVSPFPCRSLSSSFSFLLQRGISLSSSLSLCTVPHPWTLPFQSLNILFLFAALCSFSLSSVVFLHCSACSIK